MGCEIVQAYPDHGFSGARAAISVGNSTSGVGFDPSQTTASLRPQLLDFFIRPAN
jgi:hypothetical protein